MQTYIENPYFKISELQCRETGKYGVQSRALYLLIATRIKWDRPMIITSAYRHYGTSMEDSHSIEWAKGRKSGQHAHGLAFDIQVSDGATAYDLIKLGFDMGWTGIGYKDKEFIHLDLRSETPVFWNY